MPNKTKYIGLNQWEGSDPFLRTDFNADNAAIDAAMNGALTRMTVAERDIAQANSVAAVRYLYLSQALHDPQLTLDVENWYSGAKRGLVLDAFSSLSRFGSATQGIEIDPENRRLVMGSLATQETDFSSTDNYVNSYSPTQPYTYLLEMHGCSILKTITLSAYFYGTRTFDIKAYTYDPETGLTGDVAAEKTFTRTSNDNSHHPEQFTLDFVLSRGHYQICVSPSESMSMHIQPRFITFAPYSLTTGVFESIKYPFASYENQRMVGLVRHSEGEIDLRLIAQNGTRYRVTKRETTETVNVDGRPCLQTVFDYTSILSLGAEFSVHLTLTNAAGSMEIYNYSVVFI